MVVVPLQERKFQFIYGYSLDYVEVSSHGFPPIGDGSWRPIVADLDWLEALNPSISSLSSTLNLSAFTSTLSNVFVATNHTSIAQADNTTQYAQSTPFNFFETITSIIVADEISRVGYARQLDSETFYSDDVTESFSIAPALTLCPRTLLPGA